MGGSFWEFHQKKGSGSFFCSAIGRGGNPNEHLFRRKKEGDKLVYDLWFLQITANYFNGVAGCLNRLSDCDRTTAAEPLARSRMLLHCITHLLFVEKAAFRDVLSNGSYS